MLHYKNRNSCGAERGSALVYILIAIALLAALTISFMEPSSQQTSSQNTFKTVTAVQGQADIIRSAIQECVLAYPRGDSTIDTSGSGTDPGARNNYPIKPNSTHFTGATIGPTTGTRLVRDIRCPGNPGDDKNQEKIFSGATGKFMPPAPDLFEDWQYYNGTDGIYFWTQTSKTDAFLLASLQKLDERYGECEADVINATSGAVDLDSAGTAETQCPSGDVCFRVWMIANASAEYNGDSDNDEASCP